MNMNVNLDDSRSEEEGLLQREIEPIIKVDLFHNLHYQQCDICAMNMEIYCPATLAIVNERNAPVLPILTGSVSII